MEFSKKQKKILRFIIINTKQEMEDYTFKKLLESILRNFYPQIGVKFEKSKFIISLQNKNSGKLNFFKDELFDLILLLDILKTEKYIFFSKKKENCEFTFEFTKLKNGSGKNAIEEHKFYTLEEKSESLLDLINSEFYITPSLRALNRKFLFVYVICDDNQFNFMIAIFSILCSVIFSAIGICSQFYIAKNINTVVEFAPIKNEIREEIIISRGILYEKKEYLKLNKFVEKESF